LNYLNTTLRYAFTGFLLFTISLFFAKAAGKGIPPTIYLLSLITLLLIFLRSKIGIIVFIYIVITPLGEILPGKAILLPGLNLGEIISLALIVKYLTTYRIQKTDYNQNQRMAIILSFFFIIVFLITYYLKSYFIYGMGGISDQKFIIRVVKLIIQFICIFIVIDFGNRSSYGKIWIKKGIVFGFIFLGLNIYFTQIFHKLGLVIGGLSDLSNAGVLKSSVVGLFSGDSNYFAHYMLVGMGLFLAVLEKKYSKMILFAFILSFAAILVSASKAGFVGALILLIIFISNNILKGRKTVISILIFIVMLGLYQYFGDHLRTRVMLFYDRSDRIEESNRFIFQTYYINEMINNKYILISGYWDKSTLYTKYHRWRIPHNQYLGMLFWGGLPYLIIFLIILFKIFRLNKKSGKSLKSISIIYPLFGFSFMYLFNPNAFIVYFPLVLSISHGYFENTPDIKRITY